MSRESREGVAVNEVDNLEGAERPVNVATGPTVTRAQEWLVSVCVMHKGGLRITRIYMYMGDVQQTDDHYQLHASTETMCISCVGNSVSSTIRILAKNSNLHTHATNYSQFMVIKTSKGR